MVTGERGNIHVAHKLQEHAPRVSILARHGHGAPFSDNADKVGADRSLKSRDFLPPHL